MFGRCVYVQGNLGWNAGDEIFAFVKFARNFMEDVQVWKGKSLCNRSCKILSFSWGWNFLKIVQVKGMTRKLF